MLRGGHEPAKDVRRELQDGTDRGLAADPKRVVRYSDRNWFGPIEKMLDGVDLRREDSTDARVSQLRKTLVAAAHLLVSVASVEERPGSVSEVTLRAAKKVLRDHEKK
jgi:hypothetical protein